MQLFRGIRNAIEGPCVYDAAEKAYHEKQYSKAIKLYKKAGRLGKSVNNDLYFAYYNRAVSRFNADQYATALQDINKAIEKKGSRIDTYILRARIRRALGYHEAARGDDRKITALREEEVAERAARDAPRCFCDSTLRGDTCRECRDREAESFGYRDASDMDYELTNGY